MRNLTAGMVLPAPTPDAVREQLERIVSSAEFMVPDRGRRFLRYVVDEALAGRSHYLKAFTIAQEVFGRDASFDPQNDPCVRMAASQLRRSLERYYLVEGGSDSVLITMPRGQYVPVFTANPVGVETASAIVEDAIEAAQNATPKVDAIDLAPEKPQAELPRGSLLMRWVLCGALVVVVAAVVTAAFAERQTSLHTDVPTVHVEPFTERGQNKAPGDVAHALADELMLNLSRSKELLVITNDDDASEVEPTYVLEGSLGMEGHDVRSIARLVRNADGAVVWSGIYNVDATGKTMLDVETTIARSISTAVLALRTSFRGDRP